MRLRFVGALVVTLAIAATPVWAGGRAVDFPAKAVLVNVALPEEPAKPEPERVVEQRAAAPSAPDAGSTAASVVPKTAAKAVADVSRPEDLVYVQYVIKANDDTPVAAAS